MATLDRVNNIYPVFQRVFSFTSNGILNEGFSLLNFTNGFFILYGTTDYIDGDYSLDLEESEDGGLSGVTIPADRLYFPKVLDEAIDENPFDPLIITTPGGLFDITTGIARMVGIRDLKASGLRVQVTGSGITFGATILLQVWDTLNLLPANVVQLEQGIP